MTDVAAQQSTEWPVVSTDAGPVILASVEQLESRVVQWRDWVVKAKALSEGMRSEANDRLAAAGEVLVTHQSEWAVPTELQASVQEATSLTDNVKADDANLGILKAEEATSGLFGRIGLRHHEREVERDREVTAARLRSMLIPIARSAPATTVLEADSDRKSAADLEAQAGALDAQTQAAGARISAYGAELQRRRDATTAMGFDSLYEAAVLQTTGAQVVDSPLVLKGGERAYLSVPATLARIVSRTHYVGGSTGFSFPIGHTGIRYRVGSFRGQPVQQESLTKLDTGTFVLTNQRIAYVGRTKSVSVALNKVIHVEIYNDAMSVAHEGRETPDFYLIGNPKHAVFLINWALSQHPS